MAQQDDIEHRLTDIELLLSHQEQTMRDLSDMVAQQWEALERLVRKLDRLEGQLNERSDSPETENAAEPPPPHY
jgi:SlyX protein